MMMMMMMMMTMENVVDDDDDDDDVMTTTAKQSSSKISKKKKKRTTLLFLAIYQSVVSLRRDVFLRLSVSLSVCKSAFILSASPWSGERFFGGRHFFKTENVPFFFKEKHKCVTRHEERLTKCKKNGEKGITPPFVLEMDEEKEKSFFCEKKKKRLEKRTAHRQPPPVDLT
jgi:hypothetical protein